VASNLVPKRQNLASRSVDLATKFTDALYGLQLLMDERAKLPEDFQDSDFQNTDLAHLDAGMLGSLFDFVLPAFIITYEDEANGERNKQILMQVRR
jgi:hypothetical protein